MCVTCEGLMDGWMDTLPFYYSFNSSSVILARCKRDEERLCANYSTPVVVERIHTFSWIQIQIADLPYLSGYKTGFSAL